MPIEKLVFGERICDISKSELMGTLRSVWQSQLTPSSIEWVVKIECRSTELFKGYKIEPEALFAFCLKERINWKAIAPAILTAEHNLYGTIYCHEHFDFDKGCLSLKWSNSGELEVSGEFEGTFERDDYGYGRVDTLASWGGIQLLDTGDMTVEEAKAILEKIFDISDMSVARINGPMIDGRHYSKIVFSSVWP